MKLLAGGMLQMKPEYSGMPLGYGDGAEDTTGRQYGSCQGRTLN